MGWLRWFLSSTFVYGMAILWAVLSIHQFALKKSSKTVMILAIKSCRILNKLIWLAAPFGPGTAIQEMTAAWTTWPNWRTTASYVFVQYSREPWLLAKAVGSPVGTSPTPPLNPCCSRTGASGFVKIDLDRAMHNLHLRATLATDERTRQQLFFCRVMPKQRGVKSCIWLGVLPITNTHCFHSAAALILNTSQANECEHSLSCAAIHSTASRSARTTTNSNYHK